MAYNTLTGTVNFSNAVRGAIESMVDDYSTQIIGGTKSFTSTLSASAFRSEAGDIVPTPFSASSTINSDAPGRLIISDGDGTATCDATLTFSRTPVGQGTLTASYFSGSARGLTALPIGGANVIGELSASNIYFGVGLNSASSEILQLVVTGGDGIVVDSLGVHVDLRSNGGLGMTSSKLRVDPYDGTAKASLSNNDQFLISDSDSSNVLKSSTMTVLKTYMQDGLTFTSPAGSDSDIQTKSGAGFAGSSNLTFDGTALLINAEVSASINISASAFYGDGSNLTNVAGGDSTGSGGTGEVQYLITTDGAFTSNGAFVFNSGSAGPEAAYLTCSNLVATHNSHLSGAIYEDYSVKTNNYTLTNTDHIIYMSGNVDSITASLPEASTVNGIVYYVKNVSAHQEAEVNPAATQKIDNALLYTLGPTDGIQVQSIYASQWQWSILSQKPI